MQELLIMLAGWLAYGIIHSFLATLFSKRRFSRWFGERAYFGLYRLFFNAIAGLTALPLLALLFLRPGPVIWTVEPPLAYLFLGIQAAGFVGLLISLLQIDAMRFLGLRQFEAWLNGRPLPLPTEQLSVQGVYRIVRHPLYLFSLMLLWPVTTMTSAWLGMTIGATVYFIIGSFLEENKLLRIFGEDYAVYRDRVPWLIPFLKLNLWKQKSNLQVSERERHELSL